MNKIELRKAEVSDEYRKKWNDHGMTYYHLYVNGVKKSDNLYRKGGFFNDSNLNNDYFILLKQVEDYYNDTITTDLKDKPHLAQHSTIINNNGDERYVADHFDTIYHLGGVVFSIKNIGGEGKIMNVLTGEIYSKGYYDITMSSEEYVFVDNRFTKDKDKKGVLKINKSNGSYELFK